MEVTMETTNKSSILLSEQVRFPKNNTRGPKDELTLSEQRWGGKLRVTKLHATIFKKVNWASFL
jgi:hypothetical protein